MEVLSYPAVVGLLESGSEYPVESLAVRRNVGNIDDVVVRIEREEALRPHLLLFFEDVRKYLGVVQIATEAAPDASVLYMDAFPDMSMEVRQACVCAALDIPFPGEGNVRDPGEASAAMSEFERSFLRYMVRAALPLFPEDAGNIGLFFGFMVSKICPVTSVTQIPCSPSLLLGALRPILRCIRRHMVVAVPTFYTDRQQANSFELCLGSQPVREFIGTAARGALRCACGMLSAYRPGTVVLSDVDLAYSEPVPALAALEQRVTQLEGLIFADSILPSGFRMFLRYHTRMRMREYVSAFKRFVVDAEARNFFYTANQPRRIQDSVVRKFRNLWPQFPTSYTGLARLWLMAFVLAQLPIKGDSQLVANSSVFKERHAAAEVLGMIQRLLRGTQAQGPDRELDRVLRQLEEKLTASSYSAEPVFMPPVMREYLYSIIMGNPAVVPLSVSCISNANISRAPIHLAEYVSNELVVEHVPVALDGALVNADPNDVTTLAPRLARFAIRGGKITEVALRVNKALVAIRDYITEQEAVVDTHSVRARTLAVGDALSTDLSTDHRLAALVASLLAQRDITVRYNFPVDNGLVQQLLDLQIEAISTEAQASRFLSICAAFPDPVRRVCTSPGFTDGNMLLDIVAEAVAFAAEQTGRVEQEPTADYDQRVVTRIHTTATLPNPQRFLVLHNTYRETLDYYAHLRAELQEQGINVMPLMSRDEVTYNTRFQVPAGQIPLPDNALVIDPLCFGDREELTHDWARQLLTTEFVVPRSIPVASSVIYHRSAIPAALHRPEEDTNIRMLYKSSARVGPDHVAFQTSWRQATRFLDELVPAISSTVQPGAKDACIWTRPENTDIITMGADTTYGDDEFTTIRLPVWKQGDCFQPFRSAPLGLSTFQAPFGLHLFHGHPLPWLESDFLRNNTAASDLIETNFVAYHLLSNVTQRFSYGAALPRVGSSLLYLYEHAKIPGAIVADGTGRVLTPDMGVDNGQLRLAEAVAARTLHMMNMFSSGGQYKINAVRQLPFSKRMVGRTTRQCIHEQLVTAESATFGLTFHITRGSLRGPITDRVLEDLRNSLFGGIDEEVVSEDLDGNPRQRRVLRGFQEMHNSFRDLLVQVVQRGKTTLADAATVDFELANVMAVQRIWQMLKQARLRADMAIVYEVLLEAMKGSQLILEFPTLRLARAEVDRLKELIKYIPWGPFTNVAIVEGFRDNATGLSSIYPLHYQSSFYVVRGVYGDIGTAIRHTDFHMALPARTTAAQQGLVEMARLRVSDYFLHVSPMMESNAHLLAALFHAPAVFETALLMRLLQRPARVNFRAYVASVGAVETQFIHVLERLRPCVDDLDNNPETAAAVVMQCGCSLTSLAQIFECRRNVVRVVNMIDFKTLGLFGYHQTCRTLQRLTTMDQYGKDSPIFNEHELQVISQSIIRGAADQPWATEAQPWSPALGAKLSRSDELAFVGMRTVCFFARRSDPVSFQAWQRTTVSSYLRAQARKGLNMSQPVVDAAAFLLRQDYAVVDGAGMRPTTIRMGRTVWSEKMSAEHSLLAEMRRQLEPVVLALTEAAVQEYEDAKEQVEQAREAPDMPQDGVPTARQLADLQKAQKIWTGAANDLRNPSRASSLENALHRLLYMSNFQEAMNHDVSLLAANNKVLKSYPDELTTKRVNLDPEPIQEDIAHTGPIEVTVGRVDIIDATPEMWLTQSVGFDFDTSLDWDSESVKRVLGLAKKMFRLRTGTPANQRLDLMTFVLQDMARGLYGANMEKKIRVFYGPRGDNAKSTWIKLVQASYGAYADVCQAGLFTLRAKDGGAATPQLAKLAELRWGFIGELDERDEFSGSLLKKITSNDTFEARRLFREPFTVRPVTRFAIHSNERPNIRTGGPVALRRVVIIICETRFTFNPPASGEKQWAEGHFLADPSFETEVLQYKAAMLWIMKMLYPGKEFRDIPSTEAQKKEYYKDVDYFHRFIESELEVQEINQVAVPDVLSANDVYDRFMDYINNPAFGKPPRVSFNDFLKGMQNAEIPFCSGYFEFVRFKDRIDTETQNYEAYLRHAISKHQTFADTPQGQALRERHEARMNARAAQAAGGAQQPQRRQL